MLENEQTPVWSVTEQQLYSYMCSLRDQNAAPTRVSHVVEALNFFEANLRFRKTSCRAILSPRVQVAAHSMYMEKRKLRQAPQLTVAAVGTLRLFAPATPICCELLFREHCYFAFLQQPDGQTLQDWNIFGLISMKNWF